MDSDRNAVPAKINAIIADVQVTPNNPSQKVFQVSDLWVSASASGPITSNVAALVAVAYHKYIEPMTNCIL